MITRHLLPGTLVCLAAAATTAAAQEGRAGEAGAAKMAQEAHGKVAFVCKADEIVGSEVKGSQGDTIGEIQDLIIAPETGKIAFVTVSHGGVLGIGADEFVVPWDHLRPDHGKKAGEEGHGYGEKDADRDDGETCFRLDVTEDLLSNAPTLPENGNLDSAWEKRVQMHYGMKQDDPSKGRTDTMKQRVGRVLAKSSELKGAEIHSTTDESFGHVEDLVLDAKEGRVAYVVIEVDELEDLNDNQYALPIEVLQVTRSAEEDGELRISGTGLDAMRLSRAPEFDSDAWDTMSNPLWVRQVYTYWNHQPYWSQTVEAGYRKPDDAKKKDDGLKERREKQRGSGDGGQR